DMPGIRAAHSVPGMLVQRFGHAMHGPRGCVNGLCAYADRAGIARSDRTMRVRGGGGCGGASATAEQQGDAQEGKTGLARGAHQASPSSGRGPSIKAAIFHAPCSRRNAICPSRELCLHDTMATPDSPASLTVSRMSVRWSAANSPWTRLKSFDSTVGQFAPCK